MNTKRMTISDDKIIAGVCSGVADHLNIDPTIVRIGLVLATMVTGLWLGCLAYYLFTLFMPVSDDSNWCSYNSRKKVKNLFLYSLVVFFVYAPVIISVIYLLLLILGFSVFCLI